MAQVFISYSNKDQELAEQMARGLETAGYSVWYYDRDCGPGPHHLTQELPAIESSQAVAVLISPHSITSSEVSLEVFRASDRGKRFIPVLHRISWKRFQSDPPEWEMAVSQANGIEITKIGMPFAVQRIVEGLKKWGIVPGTAGGVAAPKRRQTKPNQNRKTSLNPEGTVSNPKYNKDVRTLHPIYDLGSIINPETVFLVVGVPPLAELLDRPVAEILRDDIDRRGGKSPFRRGIVITDDAWYGEKEQIGANPVIAIGNPASNTLTTEFSEWTPREPSREGIYPIRGVNEAMGFFRTNKERLPQVGLWGETAVRTREAVLHYIKDPAGLASFIRMCWE